MFKFKKAISILLALLVIMSMSVCAFAKNYSIGQSTTSAILNKISAEYGQDLSNKVSDLLYYSDYSDLISDKTTLRNYYTNGNQKAWPISNNDNFGTAVTDRGQYINWGWSSAGCMSYACFFSYSVYGTIGTKSDAITISSSNPAAVKELIHNNAQPGEQLRVSKPHSIVFLTEDTVNGNEGFYYCEYWGGNNIDMDQYYIAFISYNDFASKYNQCSLFVFNAFESSEFATAANNNSTNAATITRSMVLVLDISGSMSGSKLSNTKTAAKKFVSDMLGGTTNTKIALVTYGSYVYKNCDFTDDVSELQNAISNISYEGSTNIYGALEKADSLLSNESSTKKGIVLMSDGEANEGKSVSSGYRPTLDGTSTFYVTGYNAAIYDLCKDFKDNKGYNIYTLGFGLSVGSNAYNILKNICSEGDTDNFISVTSNNVNSLTFAFDSVNTNVVSNQKIYMVIECPVDVSIGYNGEYISSTGYVNGQEISASFGKIRVVAEPSGDRSLHLELDNHPDYDFEITGNGNGTMDMNVKYVNGDTSSFREFKSVPITNKTVISTSAFDPRADLALYIDKNNDNKIDIGFAARVNETVYSADTDIIEQIYPQNDQPLALTENQSNSSSVNVEMSLFDRIVSYFVYVINIILDVLLIPANFVLTIFG